MRAKTYNIGELVLRLPEKKKDKLKPKWEGPFTIDKFLTGGATACVMHPITDLSRTHGTWPVSGDSTPSAELSVRLLTPSFLIMFPPFSFVDLFPSSHKVLNTVRTPGSLRPHYVCEQYLGTSYTEAKYNYFNGFCPSHMRSFSICAFSSPLYASI